MSNFPNDFVTLYDSDGRPLGGFGGNPVKDRDYHRDFIQKSGKSPIVLVHGNTGTATHSQWGWLKVINELKRSEFGYTDEHFWALSYLGSGDRALKDAYTANVEDLRVFTDSVRAYLDVDCVDIVGHSLGCFLILCYLAGLKNQSEPIVWDKGTRYANVGTIVLIDGAMKGLSQFSQTFYPHDTYDEWLVAHPIYRCLSPDNSPHGKNDPVTPPPPHNVRYWCCMVPGGYVDQMDNFKGCTGHLDGADQNRNYNVGSGVLSHEKVKDEPAIIRDWAVYLNSMPPVDPVIIRVDPPGGPYHGSVEVTVHIAPDDAGPIFYQASKMTKKIIAGHLETEVIESVADTLANGQSFTLASPGMWEVVFEADGAPNVFRTYYADVIPPHVKIITDSSVPFNQTLQVQAVTDVGVLFMNNGGSDEYGWVATSTVTISETALVKAMAISSPGIASPIVCGKFQAAVKEQAQGTVTAHYIAGRLDVNGYLHYGSKYGYMQSFTLYHIDGVWTDASDAAPRDNEMPVVECSHDSGTYHEPIRVMMTAVDNADPVPKIYYTLDGSTPSTGSMHFINRGTLELTTSGEKTFTYFAQDRSGNASPVETRVFTMDISDIQPSITAEPVNVFHDSAVTITVRGVDDVDEDVRIYFTLDGTVPDIHSPFFVNSKEFLLSGNGNHAISCYAKDSANNETRSIFHYVIHDDMAPETKIFPSGGSFTGGIEVSLTAGEPVEWIKYTTDGSIPDETHGNLYQSAFTLSETTTVTFRSKDKQGNLEDVTTAEFIRQTEPQLRVFENIADIDGYIKASVDGANRSVVDDAGLAVGAGWDGMISRAIVSFDTSPLPQGADIKRAYLQIKHQSGFGNPFENARLTIDVKKGKFGSDVLCQTGDWDDGATAISVAFFEPFDQGCKDSSDFNEEGKKAINTSGRTQMRLYFDPHDDLGYFNYLFLEKGPDVRLFVTY
ncbi:MAG: alpha/beta fold hydrolase [Proteobacteria bacterium]|nr:alpha/beta fold hydrolase [Pseudomonadota bacterium]